MDEANPPQQRDEQGRPSDYSRYVMGDRDPAALAAKAARSRQDRAKASKAAGRGTPADEDKRTVPVSLRLYQRGDRPVTFKLSRREAAALDKRTDDRAQYVKDLLAEYGIEDTAGLDKRAADAWVPRSSFVRNLILEDLGIEDTARRTARRRRNPTQPGKQGKGQQP